MCSIIKLDPLVRSSGMRAPTFNMLMLTLAWLFMLRLFSMFDDLATLHGVQKVETAGTVPNVITLCCSAFHAVRFAFFKAPLFYHSY